MLYRYLNYSMLLLGVLCFSSPAVFANPIYYEANNLGGDRWEYVYTIDNQTAEPINQFTVWFDFGLYLNLDFPASPVGWDGLEAQPDPLLTPNGEDGFADWCAVGMDAFDVCFDPVSPLASGAEQGGFAIEFDWLGPLGSTPGSQFFEIIDSDTFGALSSGFTQTRPVAGVPEPMPLVLLGLGLVMFLPGYLTRRSVNRVG